MTQGCVYYYHNKRIKYINERMPNYRYQEKWEHTWDDLCKTNPILIEWLQQHPVLESINLRNALSGGRTNAFVLHYKCSNNEMIKYLDIISLYPWVQKYGIFPVGHPAKIITENFRDNFEYFGLIHCKILPPRGLKRFVIASKNKRKIIISIVSNLFCKSDRKL